MCFPPFHLYFKRTDKIPGICVIQDKFCNIIRCKNDFSLLVIIKQIIQNNTKLFIVAIRCLVLPQFHKKGETFYTSRIVWFTEIYPYNWFQIYPQSSLSQYCQECLFNMKCYVCKTNYTKECEKV